MHAAGTCSGFVFSLLLFCCIFSNLEAAEKKPAGKAKAFSMSEYKAACTELPVADLTKEADQFKNRKVKYTGTILAMDFPQKTSTGTTPTGIIMTVSDISHLLPSGVLPIYISYKGTTGSFIYDTITVYGDVYGEYTYKSSTIKEKKLPRVDAKYIEIQNKADVSPKR